MTEMNNMAYSYTKVESWPYISQVERGILFFFCIGDHVFWKGIQFFWRETTSFLKMGDMFKKKMGTCFFEERICLFVFCFVLFLELQHQNTHLIYIDGLYFFVNDFIASWQHYANLQTRKQAID